MAGDARTLAAPQGDEFTEQQLREIQRLMQEMPRIDGGLKTYLSLRIAEAEMGTSGLGHNASTLQGAARVLSRAINGLDPPPSVQWGQQHPQLETEGGLDYMQRVGQYKVVQTLWSQSRSKGQKPSQLLGRSALQVMLPQILEQVYSNIAQSTATARATEEQLRDFIGGFVAATTATAPAPTASTERDADAPAAPGSPDPELVWAVDYRATIAARQLARKSEAKERVERQSSAGALVEEMKNALSTDAGGMCLTGDASGASSTVKIEEVD